jgi:hypothetical protein
VFFSSPQTPVGYDIEKGDDIQQVIGNGKFRFSESLPVITVRLLVSPCQHCSLNWAIFINVDSPYLAAVFAYLEFA